MISAIKRGCSSPTVVGVDAVKSRPDVVGLEHQFLSHNLRRAYLFDVISSNSLNLGSSTPMGLDRH